MADPIVPPWENDPLSTYFFEAEHNTRASAVNFAEVDAVQRQAHTLLLRVADAFEHDAGAVHHLGVPRMLLIRSHSAILTGMGLAMSGRAFEAQTVLRVAIEHAWYALHITRDPNPPALARIWWNRGDSPEATEAVKREFTVGKVRRTHEGLDREAAAAMQRLYDEAINFGGHPNQDGVALTLRLGERDEETVTIGVGFLHPIPAVIVSTIKAAVDVATGLAKIVSLIYPERFTIAGLDNEVNRLIRHAAEAFGRAAAILKRDMADSARVTGRHRSESVSTTPAPRAQLSGMLTMTTYPGHYAAVPGGTENPGVGGSIPSQPTISLLVRSHLYH